MTSEHSTRSDGDGGLRQTDRQDMSGESFNREKEDQSKRELLERLDTPFLRELATNLNGEYFGSYRDYAAHSREDLLRILSNKLSVEQVDTVYSGYLLCHSASDLTSSLNPESTNSILRAVEDYFGPEECVYEAKIGSRYCDLAIPSSLTAVEVKSARDKVKRAVEQIDDYSVWANEVFLAYDVSLDDKIPEKELEDLGAGILRVYEGEVQILSEPESLSSNPSECLSCFTSDYLEEIAKEHELSSTGTKSELIERLQSDLSQQEINSELKDYLQMRGSSQI